MNTTTPAAITPEVLKFAEQLSPGSHPVFLEPQPVAGARSMECYDNVDKHVAGNKGRKQHGWLIWQCGESFLEGEFHAVWRDAEGNLVDVTPPPDREARLLFLPDDTRAFTGLRIPNVRYPLYETQLFGYLEDVEQKIQQLYGSTAGQRAQGVDQADIPKWKRYNEIRAFIVTLIAAKGTRESKCPCGSGKKFKYCHGSIFLA